MLTATRVGALSFFLPILVLAGCVSTTFRPRLDATAESQVPVAPEKVRVLRAFPNEPFLLLGEIEAHLSGHHKDTTIIRKVREKAAAIGADAIVHDSEGLVTTALGGSDEMPFLGTRRDSVRFTAILLLPKSTPILTPGAT